MVVLFGYAGVWVYAVVLQFDRFGIVWFVVGNFVLSGAGVYYVVADLLPDLGARFWGWFACCVAAVCFGIAVAGFRYC